jgi:hypothetical protein
MSKINRKPRERTEVSVDRLVEIAGEIDRDVVLELRRIAEKMKAKGVPSVAVTGRTNSEKAREILIGWISSIETAVNKAKRPIEERATEKALNEKIPLVIADVEKNNKRKGRK